MIDEPLVRLRVGHQHSQFWPILACFMDYYSPIWGFRVILWLLNPRVRFPVGHHNSQFSGLLLTVLGYQSDFLGL